MLRDAVITQVDAHCIAVGIRQSSFGRYAVNDSGFYRRLLRGGCTIAVAEKALAYIEANRPHPEKLDGQG